MNLELERLKRKARKIYKKYLIESDKFDCGNSLAEHISPKIYELKQKFNKIMDKMEMIDPYAPNGRL